MEALSYNNCKSTHNRGWGFGGKGVLKVDERSVKILNMLQHSESFVSVGELMQACDISKRTVYYDMDKINDWLKSSRLSPVIYHRALGYLLPDETKLEVPSLLQKIGVNQYYYTHKERKAWLAFHLISRNKPVFLHNMIRLHQVSRGTVHKELSILKDELDAFRLCIVFDRQEGYLVEGEETDKRKALIHYLSQVVSQASWNSIVDPIPELVASNLNNTQFPLLQQDHLLAVYRLITECEHSLDIELTDDMVYSLTLQLLLNSNRLQEGNHITMDRDEIEVLKRMPEYGAARHIAQQLGDMFAILFPEEEIAYLTMNLLGSKVNRMNPLAGANEETDALISIISLVVDRFQKNACVLFQNRDVLEQHLLAHLKPAFYRVKYGLETDNPAVDTIKEKYKELFEITRKSIRPIEEFSGKTWSDTQIAYITMHFGGWLKRESAVQTRRRKAVIVCVNGMSTSKMLKAEIEQLFPYTIDIEAVLSLREYERFTGDWDFVFSTVPLPKKGKHAKVFVVNPILTDIEKEKLLQQIDVLTNIPVHQPGFVGTIMERIKQYAQVHNEDGLLEELSLILHRERQMKLPKNNKYSLSELLTAETVSLVGTIDNDDWREAIRLAAQPLLQMKAIRPSYTEAMIRAVEAHGPYIIVSPGIAIAHGQPEDGVNRLGMSLLRIEDGVAFSPDEQHRVYMLFVLAGMDNEAHLKALSELTMLLNHEEQRADFVHADTKERLLDFIGYSIGP